MKPPLFVRELTAAEREALRHGLRSSVAFIRVCHLPVKAPWLNPIEPKWAHGKRAIAEPDRKLDADEVQERACEYYGCTLHPTLPKPQP